MGDKTTRAKEERYLIADVSKRGEVLKKWIHVPVYQYEFDANESLAYNIGLANYKRSSVLRLLNQKRYTESCNAFLMWKWAGGKPILLKRRQKERLMCLGK